MNHLTVVLAHCAVVLAGSLVGAVLEGALLALLVALGLRLLPGIAARFRSMIWVAVFVVSLLLPCGVWLRSAGAEQGSAVHAGAGWAFGLAAAWGCLAVVRGVQLVLSAVRLRGISQRAEVVEGGMALALGQDAAEVAVPLCISSEIDVPSVLGFWRPRVVLPPELLEQLPEALRQIVLHELAHIERRDQWTNLLQKLALVAFPINPVLVWVERRLCVERELACDDAVLRATGARKGYAVCLANLAEHRLLRRGLSLALGAWGRESELSRRVQRILRRPEREMALAEARACLAFVLGIVLTWGIALARMPELVSFESASAAPARWALAEPAGAERHAFAPAAQVRQVAVKASYPVTAGARLVTTRRLRRQPTVSVRRAARVPESRQHSPMVLIGWHQVYGAGRLQLVTTEDAHFTYAAVPVRDGWLIVQLLTLW